MKPLLLDLWGFKLYAYPLLMGIAWGVAYHLSLALKERNHIQIKNFALLYWGALAFSWIGAKVFFLTVSAGELSSTYAASSSFWLGGGFVFYGGLIFGLAWLSLLAFVFKQFKFSDLYFLVPALTLGHAIGRLGCFLAGCCYGTQCDLAWAVWMHRMNRHPVQIYESGLLLIVFFISYHLVQKKMKMLVWAVYLFGYGVIRFITEIFRGDIVRGHYGVLSTSQWVSVAILATSAVIFLRWKFKRQS